MRYVLSFVLVCFSLVSGYAQTKMFIGEIEGPDPFICERFRMLFKEEFGKVQSLQLITAKEGADYVLTGIARVEKTGAAVPDDAVLTGIESVDKSAVMVSGTAPSQTVSRRLEVLSIKLADRSGQVRFDANKSTSGSWNRGTTQRAVAQIVKGMKKRLNWK